jgi:hypothetical protein
LPPRLASELSLQLDLSSAAMRLRLLQDLPHAEAALWMCRRILFVSFQVEALLVCCLRLISQYHSLTEVPRIWSRRCSRPLFANPCIPCRFGCFFRPCKSSSVDRFSQPLISHVQVASRWGLDIPRTLGLEKLLKNSSIWNKSKNRPVFTASFLVTFILATFVRL